MKTLIILVMMEKDSDIAYARAEAIKFLGTRLLDNEIDTCTGAVAINQVMTEDEKESLAKILNNQKVGIAFLEYKDVDNCNSDYINVVIKR